MFDSVFNTIFSPILGLNPMLSIFLIEFINSLLRNAMGIHMFH